MVIVSYLIMCFIFATTFLGIKIGVDAGLPPFLSGGLRFFVAGFILYVILYSTKKATLPIFFRKEMLLTGLCLTFGTFSTLYWAEQYVTSGVAAVLSATGPIAIVFIQVLLKQSTNRLSVVGCFFGVCGVFLLALPSFTLPGHTLWLYGCLAIIVGQVFYGGGTIYTKYVINKLKDSSPIALNAVQMMYGGLALLLLSAATEREFDVTFNLAALGSLLYLIVVGSMVGHSLYYWLVGRTNPIFPSTWLFISPVIALLLGAFFYKEPLTSLMVLGSFTIIIGTALVNHKALAKVIKRKKGRGLEKKAKVV
ncbi:DMT family transporter [Bacillus alkalicellulosilyticus]|uniref:DMT family transporter n=1 Tax=Alkalihalobacterium alkalicellulosilyticum TaxID=1912214 RepID=UPI000996D87D|nr:EamA family transporter [Bacillus alkalicellulosilyticus]